MAHTTVVDDGIPSTRNEGLSILFDNTSSETRNLDVVFIHGLNGHPKKTWTHNEGFYWPWELRSLLKKTRVMTFGYNAGIQSELASNLVRIKGVAASLNGAIVNERMTEEEQNRPLVFVTHSMGGLVSKAAAVGMWKAQVTQANDLHLLYSAVRGFVFMGTPHRGSTALGKKRVNTLKKMCKAAFTEIPPKLESALHSGSDELFDLADDFNQTSLYVEQAIMIASYYEQLGTTGLSDPVVSEQESYIAYGRANPPEPINGNHVDMVKFKNKEDGDFHKLSRLLLRWEKRLTAEDIIKLRNRITATWSEGWGQPEWHVGQILLAQHDEQRTNRFIQDLRRALQEEHQFSTARSDSMATAIVCFMQDYQEELLTQLHFFPEKGQQQALFKSMLRMTKGQIDRDNETGRTLLHWFGMNGVAHLIPKLVEIGFSVDEKESDGRTPLHLAVICNQYEAVRCLVEQCGADIHAKDYPGMLPWNQSLAIDWDNSSNNTERIASKRKIIRFLAKYTDVDRIQSVPARKTLETLKDNPNADIVISL